MSYLSGTLTVEMAFGYAPLNTSPVWTDITSYVLDANINRGRSDEFSQYAQGTATLNLNNSTRIFDPYFETGTYFGSLIPMTPMRIKLDATVMFVGFVTAWPTKYDVSNKYAVSTIPCVDATRILSNSFLFKSGYQQKVEADTTTSAYFPMQQTELDILTTSDGKFISNPDVRVPTLVPSNIPTGASNTIAASGSNPNLLYEGSASLVGISPTVTPIACKRVEFFIDMTDIKTSGSMWVMSFQRRAVSGGGYVGDLMYASIDDSGQLTTLQYSDYASGNGYLNTSLTIDIKPKPGGNYVVVQADATTIYVYVNGSVVFTAALVAYSPVFVVDPIYEISVSAGMSHVSFSTVDISNTDIAARYQDAIGHPGESSSSRLTRVLDDIGWPAAWRSIETGVQTVGTYRPANQPATQYMRQIENAEQGTICINREGDVRFENYNTVNTIKPVAFFSGLSGSTYPYNDIEIDANNVDAIFNRIDATYEFGDVSVSDSTSITLYGPQAQTIDLSLMSTPEAAELAASVLLELYKNPRLSVQQLTVNMLSNLATLEPFLPTLELGDDIVVIFQPNNSGTTIWRCLKVQGFSHTIRNDQWVTSIYLGPSPIQTNGPLLILDDSTYGMLGGTDITYNQPEISYDESGWIYNDSNADDTAARLG